MHRNLTAITSHTPVFAEGLGTLWLYTVAFVARRPRGRDVMDVMALRIRPVRA